MNDGLPLRGWPVCSFWEGEGVRARRARTSRSSSPATARRTADLRKPLPVLGPCVGVGRNCEQHWSIRNSAAPAGSSAPVLQRGTSDVRDVLGDVTPGGDVAARTAARGASGRLNAETGSMWPPGRHYFRPLRSKARPAGVLRPAPISTLSRRPRRIVRESHEAPTNQRTCLMRREPGGRSRGLAPELRASAESYPTAPSSSRLTPQSSSSTPTASTTRSGQGGLRRMRT